MVIYTFTKFRRLGWVLLMILISIGIPTHVQAEAIWVEATREMVACGDVVDNDDLRQDILRVYPAWLENGNVSGSSCYLIEEGDVFLTDDEQTENDRQTVLKLWSPVCPQGCVPSMVPVYAPPRKAVGAYLKPIDAPEGW